MLVLQRRIQEKIEITHIKSKEKLVFWVRSVSPISNSISICLEGPLGEFDIRRIDQKHLINRSDRAPEFTEEGP